MMWFFAQLDTYHNVDDVGVWLTKNELVNFYDWLCPSIDFGHRLLLLWDFCASMNF